MVYFVNKVNQKICVLKRVICSSMDEANESLVEVWSLRKLQHKNLIFYSDMYLDKLDEVRMTLNFVR